MQNEKTNCKWGGKRACSGRKRTCLNKIPFNRRINENILNMLKKYAKEHNITETEALESAIVLQHNIDNIGGKFMKIAIPSADGKLCGHFGHCENFTFVDVDNDTREILNIETSVPEEGISCQSANWIAEQGVNLVLAGGMGGRPLEIFARNGITVVAGCPELEIKELVKEYLAQTLATGGNPCGGEHHHCHGHGEGHQCGHHQ